MDYLHGLLSLCRYVLEIPLKVFIYVLQHISQYILFRCFPNFVKYFSKAYLNYVAAFIFNHVSDF